VKKEKTKGGLGVLAGLTTPKDLSKWKGDTVLCDVREKGACQTGRNGHKGDPEDMDHEGDQFYQPVG